MTHAIMMIRREHQNMTRLLDLLDRQIDLFENAIPPDYDLVKEIVEYFLTFPDLYHHPKEDLVFRKLKRRAPKLADELFDLEAEHESVSERLRTFSRAVINVMLEIEMPRDNFVKLAREFINGERKHMAFEETHFFPLAVETLTDDDWSDLNSVFSDINDPLDGEPATRFRNIMKHRGN